MGLCVSGANSLPATLHTAQPQCRLAVMGSLGAARDIMIPANGILELAGRSIGDKVDTSVQSYLCCTHKSHRVLEATTIYRALQIQFIAKMPSHNPVTSAPTIAIRRLSLLGKTGCAPKAPAYRQ